MDVKDIQERIINLIQNTRVHNLNFVTPDHFLPHVFLLVSSLRERGFNLPIVLNVSGYQAKSLLKIADQYADIYLTDYKYADADLAEQLSKCKDYPQKALEAIVEMIKQKGFLSLDNEQDPATARVGVLVRHLILPGFIENSQQALTSLFLEFGPQLPLSLMSQYWPVCDHEQQNLNRFLTKDEFYQVYDHALELGFENLYVQFPEEENICSQSSSQFLPDFTSIDPFGLKSC
jgi:putative pyruvate formate lyase activating enzyme